MMTHYRSQPSSRDVADSDSMLAKNLVRISLGQDVDWHLADQPLLSLVQERAVSQRYSAAKTAKPLWHLFESWGAVDVDVRAVALSDLISMIDIWRSNLNISEIPWSNVRRDVFLDIALRGCDRDRVLANRKVSRLLGLPFPALDLTIMRWQSVGPVPIPAHSYQALCFAARDRLTAQLFANAFYPDYDAKLVELALNGIRREITGIVTDLIRPYDAIFEEHNDLDDIAVSVSYDVEAAGYVFPKKPVSPEVKFGPDAVPDYPSVHWLILSILGNTTNAA